MRQDIQGLRAIAVIAVLIFHFWPNRLPGGYVGVDIFFVISGFLITLHLLNRAPTTFKKLTDFWVKRMRRLLPAATSVLVVIAAASLVWLPSTMVPRMAQEVMAAAVYGENWMLASTATDYLASEDAPSPVQHYWSLSVEEQYYAVWPIIIGLMFILGRRYLNGRKLVSLAIGTIFLLSLGWSIYLTQVDAASAYFVTTTRIWELALGGIVALVSISAWKPSVNLSRLMAWTGVACIMVTLILFTTRTPFPSYTALLPTVGAGLIILAAVDAVSKSPRFFLSWKLNQFLGDISYSIYLWHWPILVIAPYALGAPLTTPVKLVLVGLTILLAAASKIYIEDPARKSKKFAASRPRAFAYGLASILVVVAIGAGVSQWSAAADDRAAAKLQHVLADNTSCVGADAMRNAKCSVQGGDLYMTPSLAKKDKAAVYADHCWSQRPFSKREVCNYGKQGAKTKIALLGNSHAGMWYPALNQIADEQGWQLDTYLVSECYTITIPLAFTPEKLATNCLSWNKWAIDSITTGDYSTVVMSNKSFQAIAGVAPEDKNAVAKAEYKKTITKFTKAGQNVLVIRDAPDGGRNVPGCIASHADWAKVCNNPRAAVLKYDPLYAAGQELQSDTVKTLDMSDLICDEKTCYTVIGGLIVYFDQGHLTNSFVKTLRPEISAALESVTVLR